MCYVKTGQPRGPILKPRPLGSNFGWYVLVEWPDGVVRHVHKFKTEAEARTWIDRESAAWLKKERDF